MIELGYATFNKEFFDKEIERRKNATPVYLLTKSGCGWIQAGINKLADDMNETFQEDNIKVISGTDLLDKKKFLEMLKKTPNAYIIISDKTSPVISPTNNQNIIEFLEYNIDEPETTWEILLALHRKEHPIN